jgi:V/A-type H+-transporting ATPase subunit D
VDTTLFPTKGNLIQAINTLKLSKQGYELLDKKRNILITEMMNLIDRGETIQSKIDEVFSHAYKALQIANITIGINTVEQIGHAISLEEGIDIRTRSIMGAEIPIVTNKNVDNEPKYGFFRTNVALDDAFIKFQEAKKLTIELAEVENAIYRLATNIKRTQKRANALKNIMIPKYEKLTREIQNSLEEKDREEFARLKVIKNKKI